MCWEWGLFQSLCIVLRKDFSLKNCNKILIKILWDESWFSNEEKNLQLDPIPCDKKRLDVGNLMTWKGFKIFSWEQISGKNACNFFFFLIKRKETSFWKKIAKKKKGKNYAKFKVQNRPNSSTFQIFPTEICEQQGSEFSTLKIRTIVRRNSENSEKIFGESNYLFFGYLANFVRFL